MKKIAIVTGTRADFGLLCPIILKLQQHPQFDTCVFACASHLSPEFGMTINELKANSINNIRPIEMLLSSSSKVGVAKSTGLAVISFTDAFAAEQPDCVLVLGDRYEIFAAAQASFFLDIPIAHIHGGEVTEGAFDDALRHCISKLASVHFCAAEQFAERLERLGEFPKSIHVVGAPGVDNILSARGACESEVADVINFPSQSPLVLVTYHPVTRGDASENDITPLLTAIENQTQFNFIVTYPNADGLGAQMIKQWQKLAHLPHVRLEPSLGFRRYLTVMSHTACVLGNSSSGIIEAPSFHVPTVNIGSRQDGRPRSASIIDIEMESKLVEESLQKATSEEFKQLCQQATNPYGQGNSAEKIVEILASIDFNTLSKKGFYEQEQVHER
ncbi:UDP-N-acetylglucosamine 2-epimerase [Pseudoalteromonas sp. SSDWG2]|uniref:UDP-N-acetylglucosamine 2-epimerase n=1 Tax=Pseudoalteromonas sp. SSDWG2 TaxID=3139391 RepID=UPI003BACEB4E